MLALLLAALCSVLVSLLLKWSKPKGFNALALITWNYVAAIALSALIIKPDLNHLTAQSLSTWLPLIGLGIVLPSIFLALSACLQQAGLIKTEVAQRMSLLLSLVAAFFWFQESFNWLKILGIGLGVCSVLGLVLSSHTVKKKQSTGLGSGGLGSGGLLLGIVWVGYAAVDVLLKYIATLGITTSTALFCSFSIAFVLLFLWQMIRQQTHVFFQFKHIWLGLLLGCINFANIWFYIKAHKLLAANPAMVFSSMNILVVLLGIAAGILLFKERLKKSAWGFVALSLIAIVVLYYARLV